MSHGWRNNSGNSMEMIDIIMPVYNASFTVEKAVRSVLDQSFSEFKLIIVDDGSTDDSFSKCELLAKKDSRIQLLQQANQGVAVARNTGIENALGKYVTFIDSDDEMEKDHLKNLFDAAEKTDADIVICGYVETPSRITRFSSSTTYQSRESFKKCCWDLYQNKLLNVPWNKLFRRTLIKTQFPTGINIGEDLIFNIHAFEEAQRISVISDCSYYYYLSPNGLSNKFHENELKARFMMWDVLLDFIPEEIAKAQSVCDYLLEEYILCLYHLIMQPNMKYSTKRKMFARWESDEHILRLHRESQKINHEYKTIFEKRRFYVWFLRLKMSRSKSSIKRIFSVSH